MKLKKAHLNIFYQKFIIVLTLICYCIGFDINKKCLTGQYFDSTLIQCSLCPVTTIPSVDGKLYFYFRK